MLAQRASPHFSRPNRDSQTVVQPAPNPTERKQPMNWFSFVSLDFGGRAGGIDARPAADCRPEGDASRNQDRFAAQIEFAPRAEQSVAQRRGGGRGGTNSQKQFRGLLAPIGSQVQASAIQLPWRG